MKIVDIHTHTFPESVAQAALLSMQRNSHTALFADGTARGLAERMKCAGVSVSVVQPVATNPAKVGRINDRVLETNRSAAETGIYSFGAMHPACETWEAELERIAAEGIKGIKLHPCYEETDIDDPKTIAILRKCRELGLIVLIHAGLDVGLPGSLCAVPEKIRRALDAAGDVKMVAAHMGGWKEWEQTARLLPGTGIFLDTAFSLGFMTRAPGDAHWSEKELEMLSPQAFCDLIQLFGAERVLFGTDSPWTDQKAEIGKILKLPLSGEEKEAILGKNAERLLSL